MNETLVKRGKSGGTHAAHEYKLFIILRIYDLKSKTQELEKFKFVLDYKIKELRKQIEPKEREIKMKNKEIEDMEGELGQISLQNHLLGLNIKTMRQNVGVKDREVGVNGKRNRLHTDIKKGRE